MNQNTNHISDVVYTLSPLATNTLRSGEIAIPNRLLTLLMLIDGVAPVAQYEPFLKSLHPLEEKFLELEQLGYLVRVGNVSLQAVKTFNETVAAGRPISELHRIDALAPESGFIPLPSNHSYNDPRLNDK
jgi:hypothetical protein